jgi:D-xylonolactonase
MTEPRLVVDCADRLGECPVWDPGAQALYWIDLLDPRLHRFGLATQRHETRAVAAEAPLGVLLLGDAPGVLTLGTRAGLERIDWATGARDVLAHPAADLPHLAYNDAKVDRWGRLWLGASDVGEQDPRGLLYRLDATGAHVADAGFVVSNGPAFSPDGSVLYFSDSMARQILAYDLTADGILRRRRLFARFEAEEGLPDGITVDADGGVWVGHWAGARVTRFTPEGVRDRVIPVPAQNVTSVAFGGPSLKTLYITTAREGVSAEWLAAQPHTGGVFAIEPGIRGLAEPIWSGPA